MKLKIYALDRQRVDVRPAPVNRARMDASQDRFVSAPYSRAHG
jgi:hypothetical protein